MISLADLVYCAATLNIIDETWTLVDQVLR